MSIIPHAIQQQLFAAAGGGASPGIGRTILMSDWVTSSISRLSEAGDEILLAFAFVVIVVLLPWVAWKLVVPRSANRQFATQLADLTRRPRQLGYVATLFLVIGLGSWSFLAPLAGAAIAPGIISPDGNRKTIQHLEGGIIRAIHVREGDAVTAGQLLMTLDNIEAQARLEEIEKRYVHLLAREARLDAELHGSATFNLTVDGSITNRTEMKSAASNQSELLARRLASREGREEILEKRIKQLQEENIGLTRMIEGQDEKIGFIGEEIESVAELLERGLERKPRMLALQRAAADIRIQRASNEAEIARNNQNVGEIELQLLTMRQQDVEDVSEELAEVRRAMAELKSEILWRADVVNRTEVRSPISGIVMDVRVNTLSGILRSGDPILDIVPTEVPLIIDARVKTIDIEVVHIGMPARVLLSAYQQRNMPQLFGTLRSISPDRLVEERTGEAYYLAKVEVPRSELEALPNVELIPGMPAEVMLLTGDATVADYVLGPIIGSLRHSFRENQGG